MPPTYIEHYLILAILYVVSLYGVMYATSWLLLKNSGVALNLTPSNGRYGYIDGLRGLLAIAVFAHHSLTCFLYFGGAPWKHGTSILLNQCGISSVHIFFIITGFLFTLNRESAAFPHQTRSLVEG